MHSTNVLTLDSMYTTNINIIASIPDFNLVLDVISNYAIGETKEQIGERILHQNVFGIRTGKSRSRFLDGIISAFISFKSDHHESVFFSLFKHSGLLRVKQLAIFYQFLINDNLFYDLSSNVFLKLYTAGRLSIEKNRFESYLYALRERNPEIRQWSDSTIKTIASKYLTLLKKFNYLKGSSKKEFCNITHDDASLVYIVYLLKSLGDSEQDILKNQYTPLLMMSSKNLAERLKKISLTDFFTVTTLGYDLKVDLRYNYKEVVDVIIQRYQPEI